MSKEPKGFMVGENGCIYFQGERTTVKMTGYSYVQILRIERQTIRLRNQEAAVLNAEMLRLWPIPPSPIYLGAATRRQWPAWDLGVMGEESLIKVASRG